MVNHRAKHPKIMINQWLSRVHVSRFSPCLFVQPTFVEAVQGITEMANVHWINLYDLQPYPCASQPLAAWQCQPTRAGCYNRCRGLQPLDLSLGCWSLMAEIIEAFKDRLCRAYKALERGDSQTDRPALGFLVSEAVIQIISGSTASRFLTPCFDDALFAASDGALGDQESLMLYPIKGHLRDCTVWFYSNSIPLHW